MNFLNRLEIEDINAEGLFNAVKPDIDSMAHRSEMDISVKDGKLFFNINARDVNALRAVINSFLVLVKTYEKVMDYGNSSKC